MDDIEVLSESKRPRRRTGSSDEVTIILAEGRTVKLVEGIDFGAGEMALMSGRLRDRARYRGLRQERRTEDVEGGALVMYVQWYRETPGDLRKEAAPPRLELAGARAA